MRDMLFRPFTVISENPFGLETFDSGVEEETGLVYPLPGVVHPAHRDLRCPGHFDQDPYQDDFVPRNARVSRVREERLGCARDYVTQIVDDEARLRLRVLRPGTRDDLFIFHGVGRVVEASPDTFFRIQTRASVKVSAGIRVSHTLTFRFGNIENLRVRRFVLGTWLDKPVMAFKALSGAKMDGVLMAAGARALVTPEGELIVLEDVHGKPLIRP